MTPPSAALAAVTLASLAAALTVALHTEPDLTEYTLTAGPTAPLQLVEEPILYGQVWVVRRTWWQTERVYDETAGSPSVGVEGGDRVELPPPGQWRRRPGISIGERGGWRLHESLPGQEKGPYLVRARVVAPDDRVCTDLEGWWMLPCEEVVSGRQEARLAALLGLLTMAAGALFGALRLR